MEAEPVPAAVSAAAPVLPEPLSPGGGAAVEAGPVLEAAGLGGEPLWEAEQTEWAIRQRGTEASRQRMLQWLRRGRMPSARTQTRFVDKLNSLVEHRGSHTGYRDLKDRLVVRVWPRGFGWAAASRCGAAGRVWQDGVQARVCAGVGHDCQGRPARRTATRKARCLWHTGR